MSNHDLFVPTLRFHSNRPFTTIKFCPIIVIFSYLGGIRENELVPQGELGLYLGGDVDDIIDILYEGELNVIEEPSVSEEDDRDLYYDNVKITESRRYKRVETVE